MRARSNVGRGGIAWASAAVWLMCLQVNAATPDRGGANGVEWKDDAAAVVIAVDPKTGEIRTPTANETADLSKTQIPLRVAGKIMPRDVAEAARTLRALPGGGYEIQMPQSLMEEVEWTAIPARPSFCANADDKACVAAKAAAAEGRGHD